MSALFLPKQPTLDHQAVFHAEPRDEIVHLFESQGVMKNTHRLEEIRSPLATYRTITIRSSLIDRIIRKDWCILCTKMYVFALKPDYAKLIYDDMRDFMAQIRDLTASQEVAVVANADTTVLETRERELRLVNSLSVTLMKALQMMDHCDTLLLSSYIAGRMGNAEPGQITYSREQRHAVMKRALAAYSILKARAMKLKVAGEDDF